MERAIKVTAVQASREQGFFLVEAKYSSERLEWKDRRRTNDASEFGKGGAPGAL